MFAQVFVSDPARLVTCSKWGKKLFFNEATMTQNATRESVPVTEKVINAQGGQQSRLDCRFDLIDCSAIHAVAKVLHEGVTVHGYEENNWRKIPERDHLNHAVAHIFRHWEGGSGEDNLAHALCRLHMAIGVREEVPSVGSPDTAPKPPAGGNPLVRRNAVPLPPGVTHSDLAKAARAAEAVKAAAAGAGNAAK